MKLHLLKDYSKSKKTKPLQSSTSLLNLTGRKRSASTPDVPNSPRTRTTSPIKIDNPSPTLIKKLPLQKEATQFKIFDLLKRFPGETLAYTSLSRSNKDKLIEELRETAIATGDTLIHFKTLQAPIHESQLKYDLFLLLEKIINLLRTAYENFIAKNKLNIPHETHEEFCNHFSSCLRAVFNSYLCCDLDHESRQDKEIKALRLQYEASELLETHYIHFIIRGFALNNLPPLLLNEDENITFKQHVQENYSAEYLPLYQELFSTVRTFNACKRNNVKYQKDFEYKIKNHQNIHMAETYDFIPLDAVLLKIFPDDVKDTNGHASLRQTLKRLLISCIVTIHKTLDSKKSESGLFIKEYHMQSLVHYLTKALNLNSKIDPKNYFPHVVNQLKKLEAHKEKILYPKIKKWLTASQNTLEEITFSSFELNYLPTNSDKEQLTYDWMHYSIASQEKVTPLDFSKIKEEKNENKTHFISSLFTSPRALKYKNQREKNRRMYRSNSNAKLNGNKVTHPTKFLRSKSFEKTVKKADGDSNPSEKTIKKSDRDYLNLNELLTFTSHSEDEQGWQNVYKEAENELNTYINHDVVTNKILLNCQKLISCMLFADCMNKRIMLIKEFINHFQHILDATKIDKVKIQDYFHNALEVVLSNPFLHYDFYVQQFNNSVIELPDDIHKQLMVLEKARVSSITRYFDIENLSVILPENIHDVRDEKYQLLFNALTANVEETAQCIRKNYRQLDEVRSAISAQKNIVKLSDYAEFFPLKKVINAVVPYDKSSNKNCTFTAILRSLLVNCFTTLNLFPTNCNLIKIKDNKQSVYLKKIFALQLIALLRAELKMETHEMIAKQALERIKKFKSIAKNEIKGKREQLLSEWTTRVKDMQIKDDYIKQMNESLAMLEEYPAKVIEICNQAIMKNHDHSPNLVLDTDKIKINSPRSH